MARCRHCGGTVEGAYRFCPWCSTPQRSKLVEFFRAHPRDGERVLRVSRYLTDEPHVRFSVWDEEGTARAAISLEEDEARRLASLIAEPVQQSFRDRLRGGGGP